MEICLQHGLENQNEYHVWYTLIDMHTCEYMIIISNLLSYNVYILKKQPKTPNNQQFLHAETAIVTNKLLISYITNDPSRLWPCRNPTIFMNFVPK